MNIYIPKILYIHIQYTIYNKYTYTCIHTYIYIWIYIHMHICVYIHPYMFVHLYLYIYIYIMYIYIYACMYVHINAAIFFTVTQKINAPAASSPRLSSALFRTSIRLCPSSLGRNKPSPQKQRWYFSCNILVSATIDICWASDEDPPIILT